MKDLKGYVRQLSHYFSASLIPMLLNLLINPLVSLNMNPEDFAITGYFTSFSTLIAPIVTFYMIHYYNKRYFELGESGRIHLRALLFKSLIFFSFGVSLVCLLLLLVYMDNVAETGFGTFPYLYMAVMTIPFAGIYNLELADYKMRRESRPYLHLTVTKSLAGAGLVLLSVVLLKWGAVGKLLAPLAVEAAVFIYLLFKHRDIWSVKTSVGELFPVLRFCWPLALGAAAGYFFNGYDKAVLEPLGNVDEFGYYCVGISISAYLGTFTASISATFQPDTYQASILDDRKRLFRVSCIRLGLSFVVVVAFVLLCPVVVRLLTAGRYMAAVPYARISAFTALTASLYYIINDYSIARGRPHLYLITTMIGSVTVIALMPLMVKYLSYRGGAVTNVISYVILSVVNLLLLSIKRSGNESSLDNKHTPS